jgi:hypothetical protein
VIALKGQVVFTDGLRSTQFRVLAMVCRHLHCRQRVQPDRLRQETESRPLGLETSTRNFWSSHRSCECCLWFWITGTVWSLVGIDVTSQQVQLI